MHQHTIICIALLSLLLFLNGCTKQESYENQTLQKITEFEFSVPSELPTAYVGKPYFYSFCDPQPKKVEVYDGEYMYVCGGNVTTTNPKGGEPSPLFGYGFTFQYISCSKFFNASKTTRFCPALPSLEGGVLNFTPERGDEGEYVLEVCAYDKSYKNEICKNTTIHIMSDVVNVKGEGDLSCSLMSELHSFLSASNGAEKKEIKARMNLSSAPRADYVIELPPALHNYSKGRGGGVKTILAVRSNVTENYKSLSYLAVALLPVWILVTLLTNTLWILL
jgi:hypothetical protein